MEASNSILCVVRPHGLGIYSKLLSTENQQTCYPSHVFVLFTNGSHENLMQEV